MKLIRIPVVVILVLLWGVGVFGQDDFPDLSPYHIVEIAWNNQGNMYALGREDGSVYIYENTNILMIIEDAHTESVNGLSFSPDNSKIATSGYDNNVKIWDISTGNLITEFDNISQSVQTIVWSRNGSVIWVFSFVDNASIISVDLNTDTYLIVDTLPIGTSAQPSINLENTSMAVGGLGLDIVLINPLDFTMYRELDATRIVDPVNPPNEFTTSVAWHPSSNFVINGKLNGWVNVWDIESTSDNNPVLSLQANANAVDDAVLPYKYQVKSVTYSNNGENINSVSADGTFRSWDSDTGDLLVDLKLAKYITAASFSPDGSQLIYGTLSAVELLPEPTYTENIVCLALGSNNCLVPTTKH